MTVYKPCVAAPRKLSISKILGTEAKKLPNAPPEATFGEPSPAQASIQTPREIIPKPQINIVFGLLQIMVANLKTIGIYLQASFKTDGQTGCGGRKCF